METLTKLHGRPACNGCATGRPVVVRDEADLGLVLDGDILVTVQTDIAYVPAMMRAAAIVTETGGRFCHAAVWARENNKPTLIQVESATSLLSGARSVTVNADQGYVELGG